MKQTKEDRAEAYRKDMFILDGDKASFDSIDIGSARYVAFKAGAEWQANQSPWISLEERLPENQDIVLVRGEYGGKATGYLHGKDSGFIVYGEDAYNVFGEVTHWMPIPDLRG